MTVLAAAALAAGLTACESDAPGTGGTPAIPVPTSPAAGPSAAPSTSPSPQATAPAATQEPAGADQQQALDDYLEFERADADNFLSQNPGLFTGITVDGTLVPTGSHVVLTYTYVQALDPTEGAAYFDTQIPAFEDQGVTAAFPLMRNMGMEGALYIEFVYLNPDSSEIWSHVFMQDANETVCNFSLADTPELPATCADL